MKKAVISNRIYLGYTPELHEHLKSNLTYILPRYGADTPPEIICEVRRIGEVLTIPYGRTDLIPDAYSIVDKRTKNGYPFPEFKATLRESQQEIYDDISDSSIVNAKPGYGKTFTGLAIAAKLKQKTLVIVHTVYLRDQWAAEVEKVFGIKPGIVGSGKFDIDKPITLANIQTLARSKRIKELVKEFGLIIVDEVHRAPANVFIKTLDQFHARYRLGLSGTLERKDGKHVLIPDYFGTKIYKPAQENVMQPIVNMVYTDIPLNSNPKMPWATKMNQLTSREDYRDLAITLTKAAIGKGHKVLALSDRVDFLEYCSDSIWDAICVTGATEDRDTLMSKLYTSEANVVFGTQSIFQEGISENILSALMLFTPIKNAPLLEQIAGRIQRKYPGKLQPEIFDIVLKGSTANRQAAFRENFWTMSGYKINKFVYNG